MLDEVTISKATTESFMSAFLAAMEVDAALGNARPASMAANAVCSTPRTRPIFGGILLSDKRATEIVLEIPQQLKVA